MCEFTVYLNGEKVLEDVVFAITDGKDVVIRDIVGASRIVNNARITEVNALTKDYTKYMLVTHLDREVF